MTRKEIPISATMHIKINGIYHSEDEFSEEEFERMYYEAEEKALLQLGYTPVKTA